MYPLTIGLAIENRELLGAGPGLSCRAAVPHHCRAPGHRRRRQLSRPPGAHAAGRGAGGYQRVERAAGRAGGFDTRRRRRPHDHRAEHRRRRRRDSLFDARRHQRIPLPAAAGDAAQARSKGAPPSAAGGATAAPRGQGRASLSSPPRAAAAPPHWFATWPPSWAARTRRFCWRIWIWMPAWLASLPRPSRCTPYWTPSTTCTGWTFIIGRRWFRTAFPASRSWLRPLALASKQQPKDEQIRHVLAFARPQYDWTLVDLGRSLSRIAMAALEEIDEVCLVTTAGSARAAPGQADHSDAARRRISGRTASG